MAVLSFKFRANMQQAFKGEAVANDVVGALIASAAYTIIPGLFGLKGWGGLAVAAGVPYAAGVFLGNSGARAAAIALATTHVLYTHAEPAWQDMTGKQFFRFEGECASYTALDDNNTETPVVAESPALNAQKPQSRVMTLPSGQKVLAIPGDAAMNDYKVNRNYQAPPKSVTSGLQDRRPRRRGGMNDIVYRQGTGEILRDRTGQNTFAPQGVKTENPMLGSHFVVN